MSTPKAKLHFRYLHVKHQLRYETLLVPWPGEEASLSATIRPAVSQITGFQCTLHLPDYPSVESNIFARKKDAEQDAARLALLQMGMPFSQQDFDPTPLSRQETVEALAQRIGVVFSEKNIVFFLPLKVHFRAAMRHKGKRHGFVPATALSALDAKTLSLCKSLHTQSEPSPVYNLAFVCEAAKRCPSVICDETGLWVKRLTPYSVEFLTNLMIAEGLEDQEAGEENSIKFSGLYIPYLEKRVVSTRQMEVQLDEYYMDVVAVELGVKDGGSVLMSRPITRAPTETRIYWPVPERLPSTATPQADNFSMAVSTEGSNGASGKPSDNWNERASILSGFPIYGDAILTRVGSSWKSGGELIGSDVSLTCFYRLRMGRTPEGNYILSRGAILTAKLPNSYSGRSQWRGSLPRSLLIEFCQQHRLPEPAFSLPGSEIGEGIQPDAELKIDLASGYSFGCKVKVVHRGKIIECESERLYRSRNDAVQCAALRALFCLSSSTSAFEHVHLPSNAYRCMEDSTYGAKECQNKVQGLETQLNGDRISSAQNLRSNGGEREWSKTPTPGFLVCISYDVWLVGEEISAMLESQEAFEFVLGTGGVFGVLDAQVSNMCLGESKQFLSPLPCLDLLLAANGDLIEKIDNRALDRCFLRYSIKVLRLVEPPEERMESALFSPPLSKQRNEYAIYKIKEAHAKSLLDLGCGSGSLLDALLDHPTELECIAGVDISRKGLVRAEKSLRGKIKLCAEQNNGSTAGNLKIAALYEGSISEADSRLCGFDVATCIEVVEHMDPEPLSKFGEVVLGALSPHMLIVSTPNIEYNPILQRMTAEAKLNLSQFKNQTVDAATQNSSCSDLVEDDSGEVGEATHSVAQTQMSNFLPLLGDESGIQPYKLRNDDHRFEWTRTEFQTWAQNLAFEFGYAVEFGGVGGSEDDPGFASQIVVFTHLSKKPCIENTEMPGSCIGNSVCTQVGNEMKELSPLHPYTEVWKFEQDNMG